MQLDGLSQRDTKETHSFEGYEREAKLQRHRILVLQPVALNEVTQMSYHSNAESPRKKGATPE